MSEQSVAEADVSSALSVIEATIQRVVTGTAARIESLGQMPADFATLKANFAAADTGLWELVGQIVLLVAVTAGVFFFCRSRFRRPGAGVMRRLFAAAAAAIIAMVVGLVVERVFATAGQEMRTLRLWVILTAFGLFVLVVVRAILLEPHTRSAPRASRRIAALARDLTAAIALAMVGLGMMSTLRLWGSGRGLLEFVGTILVTIPVFFIFIIAVWRHRRALSAAVAGSRPRGRWQAKLARAWPILVICFLIVTFLSLEITVTLGVPLPGSAVLLTVIIVLLTPHLDAAIGDRANEAMESLQSSIVAVAAKETARFVLLIVMLTMLGSIWATPLATGFGIDLRRIAFESLEVACIAIAGAFLWNLVDAASARASQGDRTATTIDPTAPRSRLGTLIPLLSGVGKSTIACLALLSILVSIGVNVWPLITGLSVFGLAIGFGSQTLVKDVVSGLFFLIDDAFRFGEYIETSGAKGTVEKISIRSVTLRNSRGSVSTVPYGQMGKIQNFSRDWVIEKMAFRVAFDTDIELVRKLFKKIGQDIANDPELKPDLIEPFKSQGIADVEDGTLVVRAKFTAKPGKQSMIRRAALKAVHQAFRDNGIHAVPKPLTSNPEAPAAS